MEFVAYVGNDKENWGQITALVNRLEADRNIIVISKGVEGFPNSERCEFIHIDSSKPMVQMKEELMKKLKEKIGGDFEVCLSLASGNGKEHMAMLSSLLSIPVGVKLVVYTKEGIQFLS